MTSQFGQSQMPRRAGLAFESQAMIDRRNAQQERLRKAQERAQQAAGGGSGGLGRTVSGGVGGVGGGSGVGGSSGSSNIKNGIKVDGDSYVKDWHVLSDYSNPKMRVEFTVFLNQTNLANNNNKFYIIQLLESDYKKG